MLKRFTILLFFVFCFFAISASAQTKKVKNNQPYAGCWSGGNTPPTVYQFTRNTIKTSVTKNKIFHYTEVSRDVKKKIYLLKLKEKDNQNYLQKYLAVKFNSGDEIQLTDYETLADYKNNKLAGQLRVFKNICRK